MTLRSLIREFLLLELRNFKDEGPPSTDRYFARSLSKGYVAYYTVSSSGRPEPIPGTLSEVYDVVKGPEYDLTPAQVDLCESLVEAGLYRATQEKTPYSEITYKYNKKKPGTPAASWTSPKDVPEKYVSYWSNSSGSEYLLVDTEKRVVSLDDSWKEYNSRRPGGKPGDRDSKKTYVIPSGDVAFAQNVLEFQKLLRHLLAVDSRVTPDFGIVSPDDKFKGKTLAGVISTPTASDIALSSIPGTITAYHGTSTKRWTEISQKGLVPGKFEKSYVDQIPGYSAKNVYLTTDPHLAENYATRAAVWDDADALILKVEVPDVTKIVPDEDTVGQIRLKREYTLRKTPGNVDHWNPETYRFETRLEDRESVKIVREQDARSMIRFLRIANTTKTLAVDEDDPRAAEAGSEWVKDAEYAALMKDVQQGVMSYISKSLKKETFAYRGRIPPRFVKKWKEYPKRAYPSSVEKGDDAAYQKTRQGVLKKAKTFEGARRLRESLYAEGDAERAEMKAIARDIALSPTRNFTKTRDLGRTLKRMWQREADIASFDGVTFIHWQDIGHIWSLLNSPRSRDEISALPYKTTPWTQLRGLRKISANAIGAIIKGRPTLIANADMNSHAFKDGKVPFYEIPEEKQDQRRRSSGWNKYPGTQSPGAGGFDSPARSWEDHLVFSASDIVPHEMITFDVFDVARPSGSRGWPEALIDNWSVVGLVIPQSLIEKWGIDETLDILKSHEIPAGLSVFDEWGEERSVTR